LVVHDRVADTDTLCALHVVHIACMQVVEDALCLVFMEHQFADLLAKEGPDKMVDIVRKTWGKMGEAGRAAALQLALPADQAEVVQRALSG
jgi:hypothetical protein